MDGHSTSVEPVVRVAFLGVNAGAEDSPARSLLQLEPEQCVSDDPAFGLGPVVPVPFCPCGLKSLGL